MTSANNLKLWHLELSPELMKLGPSYCCNIAMVVRASSEEAARAMADAATFHDSSDWTDEEIAMGFEQVTHFGEENLLGGPKRRPREKHHAWLNAALTKCTFLGEAPAGEELEKIIVCHCIEG